MNVAILRLRSVFSVALELGARATATVVSNLHRRLMLANRVLRTKFRVDPMMVRCCLCARASVAICGGGFHQHVPILEARATADRKRDKQDHRNEKQLAWPRRIAASFAVDDIGILAF